MPDSYIPAALGRQACQVHNSYNVSGCCVSATLDRQACSLCARTHVITRAHIIHHACSSCHMQLAFLRWVVEPGVQVLGDQQPSVDALQAGDLAAGAGITQGGSAWHRKGVHTKERAGELQRKGEQQLREALHQGQAFCKVLRCQVGGLAAGHGIWHKGVQIAAKRCCSIGADVTKGVAMSNQRCARDNEQEVHAVWMTRESIALSRRP